MCRGVEVVFDLLRLVETLYASLTHLSHTTASLQREVGMGGGGPLGGRERCQRRGGRSIRAITPVPWSTSLILLKRSGLWPPQIVGD